MAFRDNTKSYTPRLTDGNSGTVRNSNPRPGYHQKKPAGAGAVASVNGQVARPGYKQKSVPGGGSGSIARPGFHQKIKG
jgi:hypothetical protein